MTDGEKTEKKVEKLVKVLCPHCGGRKAVSFATEEHPCETCGKSGKVATDATEEPDS